MMKTIIARLVLYGTPKQIKEAERVYPYTVFGLYDATKYLELECDIAPYREGKKDKIGYQQFVDIGKLILPE